MEAYQGLRLCGVKPTLSGPQVYAACATIDTPSQPLYTRAE
jgi:hypothetical protein